ncbi:MAG: thioredoxin [Lachnospiraceae bacterium]|jgi:thioredoxin 1|nr:thioredoxin [Lachnospiraceae bacterium]
MAQIIMQDVFEKKVLKAEKPVLVDFYADWCGPCKMMAPVLDELSAEKADQLTIYKINVDENPDIARQYRVMSIPTMILYKGGEAAVTVMGAMSKADLWKKLEGAL